MKLRQFFADAKPVQPVDHNDLSALTAQLLATSEELAGMSADIAGARVAKEHDGDRRKRALALQARERLAAGDSASAADTYARASVAFGEALDALAADLLTAENAVARYEGLRIRWESLRSCLAILRATAGNV